jgi:hypothetical protein
MNTAVFTEVSKVCARCHQRKPGDQFGRDRKQRDGLCIYCRLCRRSMQQGAPAGGAAGAFQRCRRCRQVKPVSAFSANHHRPNGLSAKCRECWADLREHRPGGFGPLPGRPGSREWYEEVWRRARLVCSAPGVLNVCGSQLSREIAHSHGRPAGLDPNEARLGRMAERPYKCHMTRQVRTGLRLTRG